MTYRSFLTNLPLPLQRWMSDPSSWAVVGSIGVHGIILAILPFLSWPAPENTEPDIEDRVSVIELGPDGLARVPNFDPVERPPFPDDFSTRTNEDFTLDDFFDLPTTSIPEPAPRPQPLPSPSTPRQRTFTWPSIPLPSSPPVRSRPPIQTPITPSNRPPVEPDPETPAPEPDQATPTTPDSAIAQEPSETDAAEPETPHPDQADTESDAIAANPDADASNPAEPATPQERLLAEQQRLQQQFAYEAPTETDITDAFSAWNAAATNANIQQGEPINLEISQSLLTCPLGKDVTVVLGVFVSADNEVLSEPGPQVLISSGYDFFDKESKEFAAAHDFENQSGEQQAYAATLQFTYDADACPNAPSPQEAIGQASNADDETPNGASQPNTDSEGTAPSTETPSAESSGAADRSS